MRPLVDAAKLVAYRLRGRRPHLTGYATYKRRELLRAFNDGSFNERQLPPHYGFRLDERIVEYPWCLKRLSAGPGRVLDAGSVLNFTELLDQPELVSKQLTIFTLAPERRCYWNRGISYAFGDLRELCFRESWFDAVVCLSTLEHVGLDNTLLYSPDTQHNEVRPDTYLDAVRELRRVLRPGGKLLLSMPFGRHVNHGWLQVFDGAMVDRLLAAFGPGSSTETHFRYEPGGWVVSSREASAEATYFDWHACKRHDPDFAAAARAVVCLELVKESQP